MTDAWDEEPFLGQIMPFAGDFVPEGWAPCDGRLMNVDGNEALFSLLGTVYGGDGRTTFGLPDLRGRTPVHAGNGPGLAPVDRGESGGSETLTLNETHLPSHTHTATMIAENVNAEGTNPYGMMIGGTRTDQLYSVPVSGSEVTMAAEALAVESAGGSAPVENRQPYTCVTMMIAIAGAYPSRP